MKRSWLLYSILFIASIIAIRQIPALSQSVRELASYVLYPVLVVEHALLEPIKTWYKQRSLAHDLATTLHQSQEICSALQKENLELQASIATFENWREVTAFRHRYKTTKAIFAPILLKQFSDTAHYILIDAGTNRGVEQDMVAVYKNCIIGRVTEVYRWYSKVVLTTDRACKIAAVCVQSGAQGIHEGCQDCGRTNLSFVSHLTKLKSGDLVISSGEGLVFPRGFALGRIMAYALDGLHYTIALEPLVDVRSLPACYVLAKGSLYDSVEHDKEAKKMLKSVPMMPTIPTKNAHPDEIFASLSLD